ncbi:hypothetical protein ACFPYN_05625 [Paenisporosarcina macmurdoensis]|uniref:DNA-binding protein n=1 Tax=Paenisporosarcina macmurdoensis TaxID=212659 RepID=A0ABW1L7P7_9BACL
MRTFSVDEAFTILQNNKITSNKESVKRWLRQGKLMGTKGGGPKKNGWMIKESDLRAYLHDRLPAGFALSTNLISTAAGNCSDAERDFYREEGRFEMWKQITSLNIWQGRFEFKKRFVEECIQHLRIENRDLRQYIMDSMLSHKKGYAKPGVLYLQDKCKFDGHILDFARQYGGIDEQITFSVIDYLRTQYKNKGKI